ncbi:hypothetical protein LH716_002020 [Vibrio vulnificus]|uniref:hypothetical protein n=1 Tax=Vibrio vulnificus TaxID=672 RepID=UPI00102CE9DF|nr:hypothetical protein [Vibrio vulnificus]EGQ9277503.1 hypothetical protein [Vibrio vulnificus]EGR0072931.1 hypothetical protein [Vibrio vulnificus]EIJ0969009.1 hypothetical protein [Vibrio vulnificus]EJV9420852.1 hypothetical protein [Vibrio vulnificus]EJX1092588.1 hypothetical protein [Vibrio vulnificus]
MMLNIVYFEDDRRPTRNDKFKSFIEKSGYGDIIKFVSSIDVDTMSSLAADGVICHSGMVGYEIVSHFAKLNNWPILSYSGTVDSTPYLRENKFSKNQFSVDGDYFELVLPEFIERCNAIKESGN